MNNLITNKKIWALLILTLALVAAYLIWIFIENRTTSQETFKVTTIEVPKVEAPGDLPQNLPIEAGSEVFRNDLSLTTDGRSQATREITTDKGLKEAVDFYVEFFRSQGYIGGYAESLSSAEQQIAQMKSDEGLLTIIATPRGGKTVVEFSLTNSVQ